MRFNKLFFTLLCFSLFSCAPKDPNKQVDEGKVNGTIYESKEIGWSIEIPNDWQIISKDKIEQNEQLGKDAMEKTVGGPIDTKTLKHLISFQKDRFNIFSSTSQPFKEEYAGEYKKNTQLIYDVLYNTFTDQGIKVDTASGKETVQGIEFNTFHTTIYKPDGKVILKQILYSQFLKGFDFGATISYNNEENKETMLKAWKNSKFTN
ncbi:MAG TPA: hypothetical protein VFF27_02705 [Bacteroidia bacterium]|jgi:hypothetical protein|nr:hypothetical protein [Bacteroidia bacterium]